MNHAAKAFGQFVAPMIGSKDAMATGRRAWAVALKITKNEELAEEVLSTVSLRIIASEAKVESESAVSLLCFRVAFDLARKEGRRSREVLGGELDVEDESAVQAGDIESLVDVETLVAELGRMHPRAAEWAEVVLSDRPKQDLSKSWNTTPQMITQFENRYMSRMQDVARKYA